MELRLMSRPWATTLSLTFLTVFVTAYEIAPASITPVLVDSMSISPLEANLLLSSLFGTVVVLSLPTGVLIDRTTPEKTVFLATFGFLIAGISGYLFARAHFLVGMILTRVVAGGCLAFIWNGATELIGKSFTQKTRGTALGVYSASAPAGYALGLFTGPVVTHALGWPAVFGVFNVLAFVAVLSFYLTQYGAPEPTSPTTTTGLGTTPSLCDTLTDRGVFSVALLGFCANGVYILLNNLSPMYLTELFDYSLVLSGSMTALVPLTGIASRISGGVVSDHFFEGRRRPVIAGAFAVALCAILGVISFVQPPIIVALFVFAGFTVQTVIGLSYTYLREITPKGRTSTAVSILTSASFLGAFTAPLVIGNQLSTTESFTGVFVFASCLLVFGLIVLLITPER